MKKIVTAVVASLGVLVAGCSCTPNNAYPVQDRSAGYSQPYQQPQVVQRDSHGDAVVGAAIGAGLGYMAGKSSARREYRSYAPRTYRPRTVFVSSPRSYSSRRSSSFGGYRSRRR